jgi:tetratricopeptide (TPR) repeat protein
MNDIFQIQDEIANAIVAALRTALGVGLDSVTVKSATTSLDAYDLYLQGRELFLARQDLPTSWAMLERATLLDPGFVRAWETLAATHSVATSWHAGDGIDHELLALAAARRALELDPSLSMPHAVIGMKFETTGVGYAGAIGSLDKAIENDPRNSTAVLWRGIMKKDMGYHDQAIEDFRQCLSIDPGYMLCNHYLALTQLIVGEIEAAVRRFESTFELNFHGLSDNFVSYYVRTGQKKMAYLVAAHAMRNHYAPVKDWIEAIENPQQDHSAAVAKFNKWGAADHINESVCDMNSVAVAFRQTDCFPTIKNVSMMWHPDSGWYRNTPPFKEFVNTHFMAYWQENGFPSQCRDLGEGDFECD